MIKTFNIFTKITVFFLIVCLIFILSFSSDYSVAVLDGIKLWGAYVLPALFPYFFLTAILSRLSITSKLSIICSPLTKRLFRINGTAGYLFFISILSGYPTGAKSVADAYTGGLLSKTEAERASALCSTSSPAFLISCVGNITFRSRAFGIILFLCHLISAIIIGFIFSFYKREELPSKNVRLIKTSQDDILYQSVYNSVISILVVGGIIVLCYLFCQILFSFIDINGVARAIISGFIECTGGLKLLASTGHRLALPIAGAICGFGGLSIIFQSLAFLKKAKIKTAPFFISKALSAVLNFTLCLVCSKIFL